MDQPPLVVHPPGLAEDRSLINTAVAAYQASLRDDVSVLLSRFRLVDLAHKVVGVGSVGYPMFHCPVLDDNDSPLFLQVKEAEPSVLERHWRPSPVTHQGQRVVAGQRIMQCLVPRASRCRAKTQVKEAASAPAATAPVPGGLGVREAALIAALAGLGMAAGPATSAVLIYRLLTFWLNIPVGWFSLKVAEKRGYV